MVKDFLIDQVSDIAIEAQKTIAEKLKAKYTFPWRFISKVESAVFDIIISKRLKKENWGNLAVAYLGHLWKLFKNIKEYGIIKSYETTWIF